MDENIQLVLNRLAAALSGQAVASQAPAAESEADALHDLLHDAHALITALAQRVQNVTDERDLLYLMLDAVPRTSIYAKDTEGRKIVSNATDARLMGLASPKDAIGKRDSDLYPPEAAEHFEADDRFVMETGQPLVDREERIVEADGSEIWILTNKEPLIDRSGRLIGLIGTGREISARKQAEERLRQSEREYKALFDAALRQAQELTLLDQVRTALARELDLNKLVQTICEAIRTTFGYELISIYLLEGDELLLQYQLGYDEAIPRIPITRGVSGRVVRTGKPLLLEDTKTDPDFLSTRSNITSEICVPLFDEARVVGVLNIEATRDRAPLTHADLDLMIALSEHVSIAINRARLVSQIRRGEAQTRALVDAIPDLIATINRAGRYVFLKPALDFEALRPPHEIVGKAVADIMPTPLAARVDAYLKAAFETGEIQVFEYQLPGSSGDVRDFEARMVPASAEEVVVIVRDITDQKNAERVRQETERMRILKLLFDDVSHDLRTPVASIVTSLYLVHKQIERLIQHGQLLSNRMQEASSSFVTLAVPSVSEILNASLRLRDHARSLDESSVRLRRMVESMIDMARLDGDLTYMFRIEDMNIVAQRAVGVMLPIAAEKGVRLTCILAEKALTAALNEVEFSRALQNLIENAINYTASGGRVTVISYADGDHMIVEVRDTGVGISPDDLPHIFDRLYRADKARSTRGGGMGLGLAIVKKVIDAHNGEIVVESKLGIGSMFRILLPAHTEKLLP